MYYLTAEASFDGAHFLAGYDGKCSNLHGHRWRVILKIKTDKLQSEGQQRGMVVDFGDVKNALKKETDFFDHSFIYEEGSLKEATVAALLAEDFEMHVVPFRPTAENFARYFFDKFKDYGFTVAEVTVYETPNNCASYSED
ncbi:6-pyruvoyl trahydropterin synthase family protein [Pseudobutyrivibrio xylanivorans]|uniref:6-carboxy-5,6,7,8-tetrahydropterin synthase n=1 Tax=Pseudobutyrivibrio xylanivorans DSM 14809 TaxID=1123012 RepID=A0A1M6FNF8_PSEXY|nr:6-carboxytetrahydropterin synthase [Pseudobutyrivibrio xylanivorans]SHI99222.1 6-pyruvoyltetrahydropterin/6-carboxytetrahydropterin synthase [Pseudobutyrivibrio xylanivorans DSM 14809]